MAKKPLTITDLENATQGLEWLTTGSEELTGALYRLQISAIVAVPSEGVLVWRTGHLEHIANLYAGDPATTERDYADDLAVARAYCREQWESLIAPQT